MKALTVVLFSAALLYGESRIITSPRQGRLSLAEGNPSYYYRSLDGHPDTYMFGYDVSDGNTGNSQFRTEERFPNGTVVGSYGYVDPYGRPHRYRYVADHRGYRVMSDRQQETQYAHHLNQERTTTESSITWTRPKKQNNKYFNIKNGFPLKSATKRRNYNNPQNGFEGQGYYLPMFNKQYS